MWPHNLVNYAEKLFVLHHDHHHQRLLWGLYTVWGGRSTSSCQQSGYSWWSSLCLIGTRSLFCWSEKSGDDHNLIVFQFFFFFGGWEAFAVAPQCEGDPWRCGRMELKVFCLDEHLSIYHNKYANHSRHFGMEKSHTKLLKAISQQRRVPKEIFKPTNRMGASPKTNIIIKLK